MSHGSAVCNIFSILSSIKNPALLKIKISQTKKFGSPCLQQAGAFAGINS